MKRAGMMNLLMRGEIPSTDRKPTSLDSFFSGPGEAKPLRKRAGDMVIGGSRRASIVTYRLKN